MKTFLSIKFHADLSNRDRIESILSILESTGVQTFCVVRDIEHWGKTPLPAPELMRLTFSAIENTDWMVVDLTEKGVGVGIEAGYAAARGIPLITIAQAGSDISTTLQGISRHVHLYTDRADLKQFWMSTLASNP